MLCQLLILRKQRQARQVGGVCCFAALPFFERNHAQSLSGQLQVYQAEIQADVPPPELLADEAGGA